MSTPFFELPLNDHAAYLRVLAALERQAAFVEVALVDEEDTALVDVCRQDVLWMQRRNRWWGTRRGGKGVPLCRLKTSPRLFRQLRSYETFTKRTTDPRWGNRAAATDFGQNDIAFFSETNSDPLLYTITHEGILLASPALRL